jgi:hypothetical protein
MNDFSYCDWKPLCASPDTKHDDKRIDLRVYATLLRRGFLTPVHVRQTVLLANQPQP